MDKSIISDRTAETKKTSKYRFCHKICNNKANFPLKSPKLLQIKGYKYSTPSVTDF